MQRTEDEGRVFDVAISLDGFIGGPNRGDEFQLHHAPVFLGQGVRLFEGVDKDRLSIQIVSATPSPQVAHVHYEVRKR